jgi:protocatechuate 3,4-dioxygenase beta subunit
MQRKSNSTLLTRRELTGSFLALGGALLVGCGSTGGALPGTGRDAGRAGGDGDKGGDGGGDARSDGGLRADSGTTQPGGGQDAGRRADAGGNGSESDSGAAAGDGDTGHADSDAGKPGGWATGGTGSMSGNYPEPVFSGMACALYGAATQGPCTEATDRARKDVSEGYSGLPMRLALLVVDKSCKPIANAKIKIWHTQLSGSYSGNTPNNGFCLKSQADSSKHYFRGVQTTDQNGRVDFDSCFPGWYNGRAIHVHFTVTLSGGSFTSQLLFEQSLIDDIFTNHPEYKPYGQPDTSNAKDNIVQGDKSPYILASSRMADGALMAAKQIVVNL